jgi:PhnB protein
MQIQPYLFLEGRCDEAVAFYIEALGAEVVMRMCYKDIPETPVPGMLPPGSGDKVMHLSLRVGEATLLLSDGQCLGEPHFRGFALTLLLSSAAEAEAKFLALSQDGRIDQPLARTFFSERFGMVTDRFGVSWMVYVVPKVG